MKEEETAQLDKEFDTDNDEEEKEGRDLFETPTLNKVIKNPGLILKDDKMEGGYERTKKVKEWFDQEKEHEEAEKIKIHPGFVATYSFGEHEYERLKALLFRLDEVAEAVMTYRKENMNYFPEYYSIIKNFFICIMFIIDTTNREKINEGLRYVEQAVIKYTTTKQMDLIAIQILGEIHQKLTNIKNFHGLGFSYEKKRGQSEKYHEAFFRKRPR